MSLPLASQLGVEYLFQGRLRGSQERLRFYLNFTHVQSGEQVWSNSFEVTQGSMFDQEDAIVAWLHDSVVGFFSPPSDCETGSPEAELEAAFKEYRFADASSIARVRDRLEQLVKRHPDFYPAYGRLALASADAVRFETGGHPDFTRALDLARTSLEQCPEDPYGHLALAKIALNSGRADWEKGLEHLNAAFRIAPQCLQVNAWRAFYEVQSGKPDMAIQRLQYLLPHHPESVMLLGVLSMGYLSLGQFMKAQEPAERMLRLRPDDTLGRYLVFMADVAGGNRERALRFASFLRRKHKELANEGRRDLLLEAQIYVGQGTRRSDHVISRRSAVGARNR